MTTDPQENGQLRDVWPAIRLGFRKRCPECGTGNLFKSYLKTHDTCPVCSEEFHHHRADDGPAYLTILVVGHILAPSILIFYSTFRPEPWVMASLFSVGTVALSLFLLPRFKGFMIAFQWAKQMHGFNAKGSYDTLETETEV